MSARSVLIRSGRRGASGCRRGWARSGPARAPRRDADRRGRWTAAASGPALRSDDEEVAGAIGVQPPRAPGRPCCHGCRFDRRGDVRGSGAKHRGVVGQHDVEQLAGFVASQWETSGCRRATVSDVVRVRPIRSTGSAPGSSAAATAASKRADSRAIVASMVRSWWQVAQPPGHGSRRRETAVSLASRG